MIIVAVAGGHWPDTARVTAVALVTLNREEREESLGIRLLDDMRVGFGDDDVKFTSATLEALCKLDESPWGEFDMTTRKLARRLKPYGVRSERNTTGSVRGYRLEDFKDVFARYLADHPSLPTWVEAPAP